MSKEENTKARQLARQIKKNPDDSFSKFALALEFRKQGKLNKAQVLFEDILKRDPEYVGVYYHLGKLYENEKEKLKKAKKIYEQGIPVAERKGEGRTKSELQEALASVNIELDES